VDASSIAGIHISIDLLLNDGAFTLFSHVTPAVLFTLFFVFFFCPRKNSTNTERNESVQNRGDSAVKIANASEMMMSKVGGPRSDFWVIRTVGRLPTNWGDCDAIRSFKGPTKAAEKTEKTLAW